MKRVMKKTPYAHDTSVRQAESEFFNINLLIFRFLESLSIKALYFMNFFKHKLI